MTRESYYNIPVQSRTIVAKNPKSVRFGSITCMFLEKMQIIRSDKSCQSDVKAMSKRCYNTLYARKKVLLFAGPFSVTFITSEGSIEEFSPRRSIQAHRGKCNKKRAAPKDGFIITLLNPRIRRNTYPKCGHTVSCPDCL